MDPLFAQPPIDRATISIDAWPGSRIGRSCSVIDGFFVCSTVHRFNRSLRAIDRCVVWLDDRSIESCSTIDGFFVRATVHRSIAQRNRPMVGLAIPIDFSLAHSTPSVWQRIC